MFHYIPFQRAWSLFRLGYSFIIHLSISMMDELSDEIRWL